MQTNAPYNSAFGQLTIAKKTFWTFLSVYGLWYNFYLSTPLQEAESKEKKEEEEEEEEEEETGMESNTTVDEASVTLPTDDGDDQFETVQQVRTLGIQYCPTDGSDSQGTVQQMEAIVRVLSYRWKR